MTGRGFSLASYKKKDDKNKDEDSTPLNPSVQVTAPKLFAGTGRGIHNQTFQLKFPSGSSNIMTIDDNASIVNPTLLIGKGRGVTAGRGLFSVNQSNDVSPAATTSGIVSGRGISGRDSSSDAKQSASLEDSGVLKTSDTKSLTNATSIESSNEVPLNIPNKKRGTKGREFPAMSNSIMLHCDADSGVFEYEVRFTPLVDNMQFRYKYLLQHRELIGNTRTFDGVILFLPRRLPDKTTKLVSKSIADESEINVEIIFKRQKQLGDCMQLFNILFEKVFKVLDYLRVGRKMFDPTAPLLVPQHKLELWPGYVKSVEELEGGLMLTLDVSHRVISTRTVLEAMSDCYRSDKDSFKENISKALIGE